MALAQTHINPLADGWWMLVIRGIAAILFGILTFVAPRISLLALVLLWGAYSLVDGGFALTMTFRRAGAGARWGWLLFEGIVGIGAALVAFFWPSITAMVLLIVIAVRAVLAGIAQLALAVRLRKVVSGEWVLAVTGILSVAFGVLLLLYPSAGALAVLWVIASYAIMFGVFLMALGVRLRGWGRSAEGADISRAAPTPA